MAKYKRYDYDQLIMLPVSLEKQLSPGTLEFAIHTLVETRMELSLFFHLPGLKPSPFRRTALARLSLCYDRSWEVPHERRIQQRPTYDL